MRQKWSAAQPRYQATRVLAVAPNAVLIALQSASERPCILSKITTYAKQPASTNTAVAITGQPIHPAIPAGRNAAIPAAYIRDRSRQGGEDANTFTANN